MNPFERARRTVWSAVGREPEAFDAGALQWMADGPLHNALGPFCPAGRLSWAETKAREVAQVREVKV